MRLFGRSVDTMFVVDGQGRDVFFPLGRWGRGRILDDKDHAVSLKNWLSWVHTGNLALFGLLFFVLVVLLDYSIFMGVAAGLLFGVPIQFFVSFKKVRRCPISETKLPSYWGQASRRYSASVMWFLLVISVFFDFLIGAVVLLAYLHGDERLELTFEIGVVFLIFFVSPFFWGWLLYVRKLEREKIDPDIFS